MKETGTDHWQSESSGTSNSSGFTARGAGYRHYNIGNYGWTNNTLTLGQSPPLVAMLTIIV